MAAPHVTGVVAVYLESHPAATPAEVSAALLAAATRDRLAPGGMLPNTPNRLLFSGVARQA
jgi:subtilisin family serine protease